MRKPLFAIFAALILGAWLIQAPSGGGGGGIALVAHTIVQCSSNCATGANIQSPSVNASTGNLAVVAVSTSQTTGCAAIVDTDGVNTYTLLATYATAAGVQSKIYYTFGSFSSSVAWICNGTSALFPSMAVEVFSGAVASPADVNNGAQTTAATTIATGSITPGANNEVVVSGGGFGATSVTVNCGACGLTITDQAPTVAATAYGVYIGYIVQTTATSVNYTWANGGTSSDWATFISAWK